MPERGCNLPGKTCTLEAERARCESAERYTQRSPFSQLLGQTRECGDNAPEALIFVDHTWTSAAEANTYLLRVLGRHVYYYLKAEVFGQSLMLTVVVMHPVRK